MSGVGTRLRKLIGVSAPGITDRMIGATVVSSPPTPPTPPPQPATTLQYIGVYNGIQTVNSGGTPDTLFPPSPEIGSGVRWVVTKALLTVNATQITSWKQDTFFFIRMKKVTYNNGTLFNPNIEFVVQAPAIEPSFSPGIYTGAGGVGANPQPDNTTFFRWGSWSIPITINEAQAFVMGTGLAVGNYATYDLECEAATPGIPGGEIVAWNAYYVVGDTVNLSGSTLTFTIGGVGTGFPGPAAGTFWFIQDAYIDFTCGSIVNSNRVANMIRQSDGFVLCQVPPGSGFELNNGNQAGGAYTANQATTSHTNGSQIQWLVQQFLQAGDTIVVTLNGFTGDKAVFALTISTFAVGTVVDNNGQPLSATVDGNGQPVNPAL